MIPQFLTPATSISSFEVSDQVTSAVSEHPPLRAEDCIAPSAFAAIRRRAILDGCKWDPQVGDVSTLAPFPLVLSRSSWEQLAHWAEELTAEILAAEREIVQRPELLKLLGLSAPLRRVLGAAGPLTPPVARTMRFDFHFTVDGWRVSEVNSDVPGGFTESSFFTELVAEHFSTARPSGNPAEAWAKCVATTAGVNGVVCLLSAPGFMEDHQIMAYLASRLRTHGCQTFLGNPRQVSWHDGIASLAAQWYRGPVNALVRFYQAEWLPSLPRYARWSHFVREGRTPVANPGVALISESKRLPLVWDRLSVPLRTWRKLLPHTRDPRDETWHSDDGWLLKSAFSNTADDVCMRDRMTRRAWRKLQWEVRFRPGKWIAQRRFESTRVDTPMGPVHACLGVYTIDGRAAGTYGRIARKPLIDYTAVDVAVLVE